MYSDMYINAVALKKLSFKPNGFYANQCSFFICLVIFVVVDYVFIVKNPENINKHGNGMRKGKSLFVFPFLVIQGYYQIMDISIAARVILDMF